MSDKAITSTTQEFLDVYDIVNDMVILKDASVSIILQIGTMNFSLLAEQEQDAVIFTYGSLLNSLNYPIQINIQSQTKDATKYLRLLDEQAAKASSERKSALIKQYRGFVESLIKERNVLQKRFYIVTTAGSAEMGLITPTGLLPGQSTFSASNIEKSILLEKAANILEPRREHLIAQFNRLGLFARQLTTQEIIQNFYINYNPEAAEGQEISSSENYTTPLVRASFGGNFMQINNLMNNQAAVSQSTTNQTPVNPAITSPIESTQDPAQAPMIPVAQATDSQEINSLNTQPNIVQEASQVNSTSTHNQTKEQPQQQEQPLQHAVDQNIQALDQIQPELQPPNPTISPLSTELPPQVIQDTAIMNNQPMYNQAEEQVITQETPPSTSPLPLTSPETPVEINLNLDQSLLNQDQSSNNQGVTTFNQDSTQQSIEAQPLSDTAISPAITPDTPTITPQTITEALVADVDQPQEEIDFSEEIVPIQNVFDSDDDKENKTTT
jgi:hypothetical protein